MILDDCGGVIENLARLKSHNTVQSKKVPTTTVPDSGNHHPTNQPETVAATSAEGHQHQENENRNLVYLISETDFVESESKFCS